MRCATTLLAMTEAFIMPMMRYCVRKAFGFNHKIMINVQESPPTIMITRNL
jgi:hypothetical protein